MVCVMDACRYSAGRLLFDWSADHPGLHPFLTRRSSDLAALELLVVGYPELKGLVEPLAAKAQAGCSEAEFSRAILEAKAGGVTAPAMDTKQGNGMTPPAKAKTAPATGEAESAAIDTAGIYSARAQAQTPQA